MTGSGPVDKVPPVTLRLVRGNPAPEEIAALVAVLAARVADRPGADPAPRRRSGWSDRSAALRRPLHTGVRAWALSGLEKGSRTRADW